MSNADESPAEAGERKALQERMDALTARASEDDPPAGPVLAASMTGLRAELGGLRADLGSLRADVGALRNNADGQGGRLSAAVAGLREQLTRQEGSHEQLLARLDELASRPGEVSASSGVDGDGDAEGAVEARLAAIEDTLDGLAERLEALARDSAADAGERLASLDDRVAALSETVESEREAAADALRGALSDLGQAVDQSLRTLSASLSGTPLPADSRPGVAVPVEELTARLDDVHAALAGQAGEVSTVLTQHVDGELASLRSDLADALDEVREQVQESLNEARESIGETVGAVASERIDGAAERLEAAMTAFGDDWRPRTEAVVAEARAAADGALVEIRTEHSAALAQLSGALTDNGEALRAARAGIEASDGALQETAGRLVAAGQALLGYLARRDLLLEQERDRVLHELLDDFAAGLSAKERAKSAGRLSTALANRRDSRDAERFRKTKDGQPAVEIPEVPEEVAALDPAAGVPVEGVPVEGVPVEGAAAADQAVGKKPVTRKKATAKLASTNEPASPTKPSTASPTSPAEPSTVESSTAEPSTAEAASTTKQAAAPTVAKRATPRKATKKAATKPTKRTAKKAAKKTAKRAATGPADPPSAD